MFRFRPAATMCSCFGFVRAQYQANPAASNGAAESDETSVMARLPSTLRALIVLSKTDIITTLNYPEHQPNQPQFLGVRDSTTKPPSAKLVTSTYFVVANNHDGPRSGKPLQAPGPIPTHKQSKSHFLTLSRQLRPTSCFSRY